MQATSTARSTPSILAVVVLYNCAVSDSPSASSLCRILSENAALAELFSVVLYDNSPLPQTYTALGFLNARYVHDPTNGGLASAYNFALARAEAEGRAWLLLFDQDTLPTSAFLHELAETAATQLEHEQVGAIVPKLLVKERIYSPEDNFLYQVRHPLQRFRPIKADTIGVQQDHLNAYNSGAALRVSAVRAIGGFPREFWLDYLDHAVFRALFDHGYRIFVMNAQLTHDSSLADFTNVPLWRLRNILQAQTLFVNRSGSRLDRWFYRLFLLRFSRGLWKHRKGSPVWKEAARQAVLLRVKVLPRPGEDLR